MGNSESNALSERSESKGCYVYILLCADNSYYIGIAGDVAARVAGHNAGKGATHTACRLPVRLVYSEAHSSEVDAVRREQQLKGWTRAKKRGTGQCADDGLEAFGSILHRKSQKAEYQKMSGWPTPRIDGQPHHRICAADSCLTCRSFYSAMFGLRLSVG